MHFFDAATTTDTKVLAQSAVLVASPQAGNEYYSKSNLRHTSSKVLASKRMLDSNSSACDVKSAEEIRLEALLVDLNNQLSSSKAVLNETRADYDLYRNAYYDKYNLANATFDQLLLAEHDLNLQGNNTVEKLKAYFNAYQSIDEFDSNYSNTVNSFNETYELFLIQNQTYAEKLEEGNQTEIEQAESALNATMLQLVSLSCARTISIIAFTNICICCSLHLFC